MDDGWANSAATGTAVDGGVADVYLLLMEDEDSGGTDSAATTQTSRAGRFGALTYEEI